MRNILIMSLLALCLNGMAQTTDTFFGIKPIVSSENKKKLNLYKPLREVTLVTEGRLAIKNSAQGDFIQERGLYNYIVFDRSNPDTWTIELYDINGTGPRRPYVSLYEVVPNSVSLLENTFEATIYRASPYGPDWHSLRVVETDAGYVFIVGDAPDRWNGKIIMKWICKKGNYPDPQKSSPDKDELVEIIDIDEEDIVDI